MDFIAFERLSNMETSGHLASGHLPGLGTPMNLFVGTSGYSYKEWQGSFYPRGLPANQMLHFYSTHFRTVEINYTFKRLPTASVVAAGPARSRRFSVCPQGT